MIIAVDGAELHYTTRGRGPACLVLSAIGTDPYIRMTQALAERLTLVYVDLRGGGRSTGRATDLTFDRLASDLEAVRTDLGAERVAILGHSILGILAIEYGRRCPTAVSHVIEVGTPPTADMTELAARGTAFFEDHASETRKRILQDNLAALGDTPSRGETMLAQTPLRFSDPRFDAAPLFANAETRPALLEHIIGTLTRSWDIRVDPTSLTVPLLLAHGRHDYVVPHVLWDGIPALLPRATFHLFDDSGHQPFVEEPDRFAAVVAEWMASSA